MFKTRILGAATILWIASVAPAFGEAPTPVGLEYCTVCHGSQLMGNINIAAPRLSHLPASYIERQLLGFKKGWRGIDSADIAGREMQQMVTELSDEEIDEIAQWASQNESSEPSSTINADAAVGERLYQTACAACHGAAAEGNLALNSPPLKGSNDWYLKTQLEHYQSGIRGAAPEDIYGLQMKAAMAAVTNNDDINNLVAYINQL